MKEKYQKGQVLLPICAGAQPPTKENKIRNINENQKTQTNKFLFLMIFFNSVLSSVVDLIKKGTMVRSILLRKITSAKKLKALFRLLALIFEVYTAMINIEIKVEKSKNEVIELSMIEKFYSY